MRVHGLGSPEGRRLSIVVIAGANDTDHAFAERLATEGRLVVACTPAEADGVLRVLRFDLLLVGSDIDARTEARILGAIWSLGRTGGCALSRASGVVERAASAAGFRTYQVQ